MTLGGARRRWRCWARAALVLALLVAALACPNAALAAPSTLPTFRIALPGPARFRIAGFLVAQDRALFQARQVDASVRVLTGEASDAIRRGEADFAVMPGAEALARRLAGEDLVVVGVIQQHSALGLLVRHDSDVSRPADLAGQRVLAPRGPASAAWRAVLRDVGVGPDAISLTDGEADFHALASGGADAVVADVTWAPEVLLQRGISVRAYRSGNYGRDFYGDVLVGRGGLCREQSARVDRLLQAVKDGWLAALDDPEAAAGVILRAPGVQASSTDAPLLLREAEWVRTIVRPDLIPIGTQLPDRWMNMAKVLESLGETSREQMLRVEGIVFAHVPVQDRRLVRTLAWSLAGAGALALGAVLWNMQLRRVVRLRTRELESSNTSLGREVEHRANAERSLAEQMNRIAVLHTISRGMNEGLKTDDLMQRAARDLTGVLGGVGVTCWTPGERGLRLAAAAPGPGVPIADEYGGLGHEETLSVPEIASDPRFAPAGPAPGARAWLDVPGVFAGQVVVRVCVAASEPRRWTTHEIGTTEAVASYLAGALMVSAIEEERRVAVTKLYRSEAQYRRLFLANPEPMWIYDVVSLRFLAVNDAAVEKYGFAREEFAAMTLVDLRSPEDVPDLLRSVEEVRGQAGRSPGGNRTMTRHRTKQGRILHVRVTGYDVGFVAPGARLIIAHDISELVAAESTLREREAEVRGRLSELESLYQSSPIGMAQYDSQLRYVRINERLAAFNGKPAGEHLGRHVREMAPPAAAAQIERSISDTIRTGRSVDGVRVRVAHEDGRVEHYQVTYYPVRRADGTVIGAGSLVVDVTALVRGAELREGFERALTQIVTHRPLSEIFTTILDAVERRHRRLGAISLIHAPSGTLRLECCTDRLPGELREGMRELPVRDDIGVCPVAAATGTRVVSEDLLSDPKCVVFRSLSVKMGLRSCWSEPILTGPGVVAGTLALYGPDVGAPNEEEVRLVSSAAKLAGLALEHHRAENALRDSERRYELATDATQEGVWDYDLEEGVIRVTPNYLSLLRLPPGSLHRSRADWERALHPDDAGRVWAQIETSARTGERFEVEFRARRADGVFRWFRSRAVAISEQGRVRRLVGSLADIHDRKTAQAELERSNKELERFAYTASHDLQEPIRMISGFAQILAERLDGRLDEEEHEFLSYVLEGSARMQRLVEDLLAYARVSAGPRALSEISADAAASRAVSNLRRTIEEHGADIELEDLPSVRADETQLTRVFQNLIANALRFSGTQTPRVRVSAARENGHVTFAVSDWGVGVNPEDRERIFELFQRVHARATDSGTGIGLAICKRIVEGHAGRIWVEPNSPRGSVFKFTIPAGPQDTPPDGPSPGPAEAANAAPPILGRNA